MPEESEAGTPQLYQASHFVGRFVEYLEQLEQTTPSVFSYDSSRELVVALFHVLFEGANTIVLGERRDSNGKAVRLEVVDRAPKDAMLLNEWEEERKLGTGRKLSPGEKYETVLARTHLIPYVSRFGELITELQSFPDDKNLMALLFRPPFCEPEFQGVSCLLFWKPPCDVRTYPATWDGMFIRFIFLASKIALLYGDHQSWQLAYRLGSRDVLLAEGEKLLGMCRAFPQVLPPFEVLRVHLQCLRSKVKSHADKDTCERFKQDLKCYASWANEYSGGKRQHALSLVERVSKRIEQITESI